MQPAAHTPVMSSVTGRVWMWMRLNQDRALDTSSVGRHLSGQRAIASR